MLQVGSFATAEMASSVGDRAGFQNIKYLDKSSRSNRTISCSYAIGLAASDLTCRVS